MSELDEIQRIQHIDLVEAEALALKWFKNNLRLPNIDTVNLNPSPVSLNSFNGIVRFSDGDKLFFKSHTEPGSIIKEYYNSTTMHEAGYNVVLPVKTSSEFGQQIVFYPVIDAPLMFDLMRAVEYKKSEIKSVDLLSAQIQEIQILKNIYRKTGRFSESEEVCEAPIHQLFYHRLTAGRYNNFYDNASFSFDDSSEISMSELIEKKWIINGIEQPNTLRELIDEALVVLKPDQKSWTVVGHGDAHFGNVFLSNDLDESKFLYFDPAFAGRHPLELDIVKPFFHNIFAQWMYFPEEKSRELNIQIAQNDSLVQVDYDGAFSGVRKDFYELMRSQLIDPLFREYSERNILTYGRRAFDLALLCCPLLTVNLNDRKKFPSQIAWLGLALSVQMGNLSLIEQNFSFSDKR